MLPQKTIVISLSPGENSLSKYMRGLGSSFLSAGYKVILIFDQLHIPEDLDPQFLSLKWPSRRPVRLKDFLFLYKILKKEKPEIVMASFTSVNVMLITARILNIPLRLSWYHTTSNQIRLDVPFSKFKIRWLYLRKKWLVHLCATSIVTNSIKTKEDVIATLNFPKDRITVLDLLVAEEKIDVQSIRNNNIAMVGRLDNSKGHRGVLHALRFLKERGINFKATFLGDGELRDELQELCRNLGIADECHFRGNVSRNEVFRELSTSKIHISGSADEAFGMVNVEALSVGTPILGQDVGGISGIIREGVNGYFIDINNPEEVATIMKSILTSDATFDRLSKNALKTFIESYALSKENLEEQRKKIIKGVV